MGKSGGPFPQTFVSYPSIHGLLGRCSQLNSVAGVICDLDSVQSGPISTLAVLPSFGFEIFLHTSVRGGFDSHLPQVGCLLRCLFTPSYLLGEHAREASYLSKPSSLFSSQTLRYYTLCPHCLATRGCL